MPEGVSVAESTPSALLGQLNDVERKHAPERLFVAGDAAVLDSGPRVALVGSRRASPAGLNHARALAGFLVEHGVVVVSGLAEGIDTAAHEAALAAGGKTIAVLGTPLDQVYPASNRQLQERLMREYLVLSQFPPGERVRKWNFPMRNRTMALISHVTIIVEAGESSGSLHQGWEALRLGRPLFILEGVAENRSLAWPAKMREYGAIVLSPAHPEEVIEVLPTSGSRVIDLAL
ncbi:MAG: DNA-processing protein DprA [Candidatus Aenigmarchaeota archaeon]|nr:DNA-processing protein DprA [Candidatus Aenigmarchaeota archaeon]